MARFHIHKTARMGTLQDRQLDNLATELSGMTLENDLRRQLQENIARLRDMGSYRGRRHAMGLPARGQRTRTQVSLHGFWW
jgi:small subunit ribosomal protein S13